MKADVYGDKIREVLVTATDSGQKLSADDLKERVGCSRQRVHQWLAKHDYEVEVAGQTPTGGRLFIMAKDAKDDPAREHLVDRGNAPRSRVVNGGSARGSATSSNRENHNGGSAGRAQRAWTSGTNQRGDDAMQYVAATVLTPAEGMMLRVGGVFKIKAILASGPLKTRILSVDDQGNEYEVEITYAVEVTHTPTAPTLVHSDHDGDDGGDSLA